MPHLVLVNFSVAKQEERKRGGLGRSFCPAASFSKFEKPVVEAGGSAEARQRSVSLSYLVGSRVALGGGITSRAPMTLGLAKAPSALSYAKTGSQLEL